MRHKIKRVLIPRYPWRKMQVGDEFVYPKEWIQEADETTEYRRGRILRLAYDWRTRRRPYNIGLSSMRISTKITNQGILIKRVLFLLLLLAPKLALAANVAVIINVTSPPSMAISCTINYPSGQTSFVAPVAVGTQIASCSVTPASWSGSFTLSGADASSFSLSGMNVTVGGTALTVPRQYNITLTASP